MNNSLEIEAYKDMLAFNKENIQAKELYKDMQTWHLKNDKKDGVFYPTALIDKALDKAERAKLIIELEKGQPLGYEKHVDYMNRATRTYIYGVWRNTLSVYNFDNEIYKEVIKSPIPLDTPMSIYERLPEWCVYILLPNDSKLFSEGGMFGISCERARGFFVYMDYDGSPKNRKLCISVDYIAKKPNFLPFTLYLKEGVTIEDAMLDFYKSMKDNAEKSSNKLSMEELVAIKDGIAKDGEKVRTILSLLLWLCAEEPDITNIQGEPVTGEQLRLPRYAINKKTKRFIPPNNPTVFQLGKRLGSEIRQFEDKKASGDSRISSRKRPHIRKGHWHGYWKGTGQDKKFTIKWLPAVFVNSSI